MSSRHRQSGYTLLEVVVAFAILTLSLSALFESFSITLRRSEKVRNMSRAVLLAESTRDRVGVELPATSALSEGADEDCRWSVQAHPIPREASDHPPLMEAIGVGIDTRCGDSGAIGTAHLETVELAPAE